MLTTYAYKARDVQGHLVEGSTEGESRFDVAAELKAKGVFPISVEPVVENRLKADIRIPGLTDRIKGEDLAVFARQLATMIDAGLPLVRALTVLSKQTESKPLKAVVDAVRLDVESGTSLSEAMAKQPKAFNRLFIAMVRAGEAGGVLDTVLDQLATILERQVELRRTIVSALTYPVAVLGLVSLIGAAMLLFVVPTFKSMFTSVHGTLPLPTRILLQASHLATAWAPVLLVIGVVLAVLLRKGLRTATGRMIRDRILLRLPLGGPLVQKTAMTRFARTLSLLLRSGVPILESLQITSETVNNAVVGKAVSDLQAAVEGGESLNEPLVRHTVFPPMVTQMLAVGEETGAVDTLLDKVADFYDKEIEATVATLTSLLEPLLIMVLGGVVGSMVVALYLPMFSLVNQVK